MGLAWIEVNLWSGLLKCCKVTLRRMNPMLTALLEFNQAFEIPKLDAPGLGPEDLAELRVKLLREEVEEYAQALADGDLVEVLDALADIG